MRTGGAASIWLDPINGGLIHDAVIENNVVTGHYAGQYVGIFVGGDGTSAALLPRNITVINNTVISGLSNSLRFGRAYATLPLDQRPLVVNNTGERLLDMCDRIRSGHNVFGVGQACTATDVIGNPHLDATGPRRREHAADRPRRSQRRSPRRLLRLRPHRRRPRHRRDRVRGLGRAAARRSRCTAAPASSPCGSTRGLRTGRRAACARATRRA